MTTWAIMDKTGIIESRGPEAADEILATWTEVKRGNAPFNYEGDVMLIEIHEVHR